MTGNPDDSDGIGTEGLTDLVAHYAHEVAVAPSAAVYDELASARSFAGTPLGRASVQRRSELTATAGWLSSLPAVSATDLGDHAAVVAWCGDAERHGRDTGHWELLGWRR
jgi:hypothetical protein